MLHGDKKERKTPADLLSHPFVQMGEEFLSAAKKVGISKIESANKYLLLLKDFYSTALSALVVPYYFSVLVTSTVHVFSPSRTSTRDIEVP